MILNILQKQKWLLIINKVAICIFLNLANSSSILPYKNLIIIINKLYNLLSCVKIIKEFLYEKLQVSINVINRFFSQC